MQCLFQKTRESPSVGCDIGRDFFPEKLGADPESQEETNKQTKEKQSSSVEGFSLLVV